MALKQQITSVSGASTEYHRISEAAIDYTNRKARITVCSYLEAEKRDEEKTQASSDTERKALLDELNELLANPTDENEARRVELSNQINALPERTPDDVAPRNLFTERYELDIPANTEFSLEFAYSWLKENVYTAAEDC